MQDCLWLRSRMKTCRTCYENLRVALINLMRPMTPCCPLSFRCQGNQRIHRCSLLLPPADVFPHQWRFGAPAGTGSQVRGVVFLQHCNVPARQTHPRGHQDRTLPLEPDRSLPLQPCLLHIGRRGKTKTICMRIYWETREKMTEDRRQERQGQKQIILSKPLGQNLTSGTLRILRFGHHCQQQSRWIQCQRQGHQ